MKAIRLGLALILMLCATSRSLAEITEVKAKGVYVHPGAKMSFPEKVGAFKRVHVLKYSPDETDVSVGYNLKTSDVIVIMTVYAFPAPGSGEKEKQAAFKENFDAAKQAIEEKNKNGKLVSDEVSELFGVKGRKALYEISFDYGFSPVDSCSVVYLFQRGDWFFKYRITYTKATREKAEEFIKKFMEELKWPDA